MIPLVKRSVPGKNCFGNRFRVERGAQKKGTCFLTSNGDFQSEKFGLSLTVIVDPLGN